MKKINIKIALAVLTFLTTSSLVAQDYNVEIGSASATTIIIKEVNRVSVEAYDGKSIQISNGKGNSKPDRAKGLKPLSARGEDNTGIGLNVQKEGNSVTIFQAARRAQGKYTIKVPKDVKVLIEHTGSHEGGKIEVFGIAGEIEVSGRFNSVHLEDITGPALVSTLHGNVTAVFSELSQKGPTSLVSQFSTVDVTLPANAKANVIIKTPYGEAYSDLDLQFPKSDGKMRKVSSTVEGTLNGGGVELEIKASHSNAYLRKK